MKNIFSKAFALIKEYSLLIIACLILAFMVRGCSMDRIERISEYNKVRYEQVIDSLVICIDNTKDTLMSIRMENDMLKNSIVDYRKDKDHYIRVNANLVNVTKQLSKRDTL